MTSPLDEPAPKARCRECGKFRPCGCDSKEWALDKAAAQFAARQGERIAGPTDGRPFGGELERTDRRAPQEVIRATLAKVDDRAQMRVQLELVQIRLAQVRKVAALVPHELALLKVEEAALRMHVEGATFPEISKALGYTSHSTASSVLKRIRQEARARGAEERGVAVLPCRCGRTWCLVPQRPGPGRPARWNRKCQHAEENARRNRRGKKQAKFSVHISPSAKMRAT